MNEATYEPRITDACVRAVLSPRVASISLGLPKYRNTLTAADLIQCVSSRAYNVCFISANEAESLSAPLREAYPGVLLVLVSGRAPAALVDASSIDVILPAEFARDQIASLLAPHLEKKLAQIQDQSLVSRAAESLRSRLEWLGYKESRRHLDHDAQSRTIIENLRISLSQGAGFGTILTLVDMMSDWKSCGSECSVDAQVQKMLRDNSEIARHHLEALTKIIELMSTPFAAREHGIRDVADAFSFAAEEIKPYLAGKDMKLRFASPPNDDRTMSLDLTRTGMAFQELLINAYKYGAESSAIDVLWAMTNGFLTVAVKNNTPEDDAYLGDAMANLTSPFLRLHPPVEDIIAVETFGLGLGLTMVEYIMVRSKGLFALSRVSDHTNGAPVPCTLAQLFLPLSDKSRELK